jgi:hypothetical protein
MLREASQNCINVNIKILQSGYDEFVESVFQGQTAFRDKAAYHDALVYTRVELATLAGVPGKKTAVYLHKATELVNAQLAWVEKQLLAEHASSCPLCPVEKKLSPLKWTGSIVEWVELVYALHLVKRINGGKISLEELFLQMGEVFDIKVKEFSNYFMNIKNRTDEKRTRFTGLMRDALLARMTESDRKPPRK